MCTVTGRPRARGTSTHAVMNLRGSLDMSMRITCPAQRSFRLLEMYLSMLVRPRAE